MDQKGRRPDYLKYSSIGIQILVIVLMFTFLGVWIDGKMENKKPWVTVVLSLAGVLIAMIWVVRETSRGQKNKK